MPADIPFLEGLTVRRICRDLDLSKFKCNPVIDWFLVDVACVYHEKRISSVTCWLSDGDVAGYITTSMGLIDIRESSQRGKLELTGVTFRKGAEHVKKFPALLIGMLGVSENYRRRGLALHMVKYAVGQARVVSKEVGCRFVTVDSDPTEEAMGLYQNAGFQTVDGQKNRDTVWMYFDLGPLAE